MLPQPRRVLGLVRVEQGEKVVMLYGESCGAGARGDQGVCKGDGMHNLARSSGSSYTLDTGYLG